MKDKKLRRSKPKKRIRGAPIFGAASISPPKTDLVMSPESAMDIARLLLDEIHKKWPNVEMPTSVTGKHTKLNKNLLEEFSGDALKEMIRVLVWDFEAIKTNKTFFPSSSHLNWPWLDQLYNYRYALSSSVGDGVTDSVFRVSVYRQRYHTGSKDAAKPVEAPTTGKPSMKDLAKRVLGQ